MLKMMPIDARGKIKRTTNIMEHNGSFGIICDGVSAVKVNPARLYHSKREFIIDFFFSNLCDMYVICPENVDINKSIKNIDGVFFFLFQMPCDIFGSLYTHHLSVLMEKIDVIPSDNSVINGVRYLRYGDKDNLPQFPSGVYHALYYWINSGETIGDPIHLGRNLALGLSLFRHEENCFFRNFSGEVSPVSDFWGRRIIVPEGVRILIYDREIFLEKEALSSIKKIKASLMHQGASLYVRSLEEFMFFLNSMPERREM